MNQKMFQNKSKNNFFYFQNFAKFCKKGDFENPKVLNRNISSKSVPD